MIIEKIMLIIKCFLPLTFDEKTDLEKYLALETKDCDSIRKSDLPSEFSDGAFDIVDKFIRKTRFGL